MNAKVCLLFGLMLVGVLFAAPASASALEWKEEGKALTKDATVSLEGEMTYEFEEIGALTCGMKGAMTLEAGKSTAKFTSLEPSSSGCKPVSGTLKECPGINITISVTTIPLAADLSFFPPFISGTGGLEIDFGLGTQCGISKTTATFSKFTANPDNNKAISSLSFAGEGTTKAESAGGIITKGVMAVSPAKKYGFG
jgi:hypothetical protein